MPFTRQGKVRLHDTILLGLTSKLERVVDSSALNVRLVSRLSPQNQEECLGTRLCKYLELLLSSYVHVTDNSKFLQPKDLSASHLQLAGYKY